MAPSNCTANRLGVLGNAINWIVIDLQGAGTPGKSNRDALGAIISLTTPDGVTQTQYRSSKPSLSAGGELASHFGLGSNTSVSSLTIRWPDGTTASPEAPAINQRHSFIQE